MSLLAALALLQAASTPVPEDYRALGASPLWQVTIRSDPSMFEHWGERLRRPATLEPHISDVGAVNPPGDSSSTDGPATLALAAEVHARAILGATL